MAENNKIITGLIVGDDTKRRGVYRVLLFNNEGGDWKFSKQEATEKQLIDALDKKIVKLLNAKNESGRIVGTAGSLDRFVNNVNHPLVIIAELVDDKNNVLGYKVADYNGEVRNVKLQQLLDHCKVITKKGGIPIQNGVYIPDNKDKKAYIRSYDTSTFITEVITRQNTQYNNNQHKVDTVKNEEALSRLEEIFTPEQINELRLGKKNGIDIRVYANPKLSSKQMRALREGLEAGVDVSIVADPAYGEDQMAFIIMNLKLGENVIPYANPAFNLGQMGVISGGIKAGLDVSKYADPKFSIEEMTEIRLRLELKIWKSYTVSSTSDWKV